MGSWGSGEHATGSHEDLEVGIHRVWNAEQCVRADRPGDPGLAGQAAEDPRGGEPVEPVPAAVVEDRPVETLTDGQADGSGSPGARGMMTILPPLRSTVRVRCPRSRPRLSMLAQSASLTRSPLMASSDTNWRSAGRPRPEATSRAPTSLRSRPVGVGLVVQAGTADMRRRRVSQQALFLCVPVEASDVSQPPSHRCPGPPQLLEVAGEAIDVGSAHLEQPQVAWSHAANWRRSKVYASRPGRDSGRGSRPRETLGIIKHVRPGRVAQLRPCCLSPDRRIRRACCSEQEC